VPELPEVETVRRDLEGALVGASVARVEVSGLRSTRRHAEPAGFVAAVTGRTLRSFGRRGKYLVIGLGATSPSSSTAAGTGGAAAGTGPAAAAAAAGPAADAGGPGCTGPAGAPSDVLVVHLRMSGQLRLAASAGEPRPPHAHVVLSFADGRELRFVDPRTFGELFVTSAGMPELAGLGVDALDPALTPALLARTLAGRRARMKPLLLDQRVIAGIGNIYSDEILWAARLRWSRRAATLRPVDVRRLHGALRSVLAEAVEHRGSSLSDAQYVDVAGRPGAYQQRHAVYGRTGQPCLVCGRPIERATVAQRSHHWCRTCQR